MENQTQDESKRPKKGPKKAYQCENLSRFLGIGNTQKKDSRKFEIWRTRAQTNQKLDKFIFL